MVIGEVLYGIVWLFLILLFVRLVVDWVQIFARQWSPSGVLLVVLETVYTITDPPIKAVRRFVPPLRLGQVALDLSFMLVFVVCWILLQVIATMLLR